VVINLAILTDPHYTFIAESPFSYHIGNRSIYHCAVESWVIIVLPCPAVKTPLKKLSAQTLPTRMLSPVLLCVCKLCQLAHVLNTLLGQDGAKEGKGRRRAILAFGFASREHCKITTLLGSSSRNFTWA